MNIYHTIRNKLDRFYSQCFVDVPSDGLLSPSGVKSLRRYAQINAILVLVAAVACMKSWRYDAKEIETIYESLGNYLYACEVLREIDEHIVVDASKFQEYIDNTVVLDTQHGRELVSSDSRDYSGHFEITTINTKDIEVAAYGRDWDLSPSHRFYDAIGYSRTRMIRRGPQYEGSYTHTRNGSAWVNGRISFTYFDMHERSETSGLKVTLGDLVSDQGADSRIVLILQYDGYVRFDHKDNTFVGVDTNSEQLNRDKIPIIGMRSDKDGSVIINYNEITKKLSDTASSELSFLASVATKNGVDLGLSPESTTSILDVDRVAVITRTLIVTESIRNGKYSVPFAESITLPSSSIYVIILGLCLLCCMAQISTFQMYQGIVTDEGYEPWVGLVAYGFVSRLIQLLWWLVSCWGPLLVLLFLDTSESIDQWLYYDPYMNNPVVNIAWFIIRYSLCIIICLVLQGYYTAYSKINIYDHLHEVTGERAQKALIARRSKTLANSGQAGS